jgi:uridine phosphorylase
MSTPIHIHPTAELAPRALLPGDPGRALQLAQALLEAPLMFNHNRGLWGYTGAALADGKSLTIQSTGMGGPSAAIVVEELIDLGAERVIRVGTCGAIAAGLELGELVVVTEALAADGTSRALAGRPPQAGPDAVAADPVLTAALSGERRGVAVSTDLFYDPSAAANHAAWAAAGALVIEMEAAAVLRVAQRRDVPAACVLAVTDLLTNGERRRIDAKGYVSAGERLGRAAVAALA